MRLTGGTNGFIPAKPKEGPTNQIKAEMASIPIKEVTFLV